ncbi:MAG TPA: hypothetical protein VK163_10920 [Opitutaceae bacterium]|nr:hypothetical protein [Opitutaceae bacterium]
MYQYRVTKYDPAFRNNAGAYTRDDWTMFRQIGDAFGGVTLSESEYLRIESAYVEAATAFLTEDQSPELRVTSLEIRADLPTVPPEGSLVAWSDFGRICRSVLREEFWCMLQADGRFVHFGWDFYMYIGVVSPCEKAIEKAQTLGLFVENCASPYCADEEDGA